MKIEELFSFEQSIAAELLKSKTYPWECLPIIHEFIIDLGKKLNKEFFEEIGENIWVEKTAKVSSSATIIGPSIIDEGTEIRPNAYIRGDVIIGKNSIVGNSTELKNCILLDEVQVPHFNYVGDSILGYKSHLGAGSILSNYRLDEQEIIIDGKNTNLKKVGAFIGDGSQVGCNSVLNPGTILEKNTIIFPLSNIKGVVIQ